MVPRSSRGVVVGQVFALLCLGAAGFALTWTGPQVQTGFAAIATGADASTDPLRQIVDDADLASLTLFPGQSPQDPGIYATPRVSGGPTPPASGQATPDITTPVLYAFAPSATRAQLPAPDRSSTPAPSAMLTLPRLAGLDTAANAAPRVPRIPRPPRLAVPAPQPALQIGSSTSPKLPAVAPAPAPRLLAGTRIRIHSPEPLPGDVRTALEDQLRRAGAQIAAPMVGRFTIARPHLRVYHDADTPAAASLAAKMQIELRDFTANPSKPRSGTIELWLAGVAETVAPAPAPQQTYGVRRSDGRWINPGRPAKVPPTTQPSRVRAAATINRSVDTRFTPIRDRDGAESLPWYLRLLLTNPTPQSPAVQRSDEDYDGGSDGDRDTPGTSSSGF